MQVAAKAGSTVHLTSISSSTIPLTSDCLETTTSGPKMIKLRFETSLKSQAYNWHMIG
jgi:hypothetical protein